MRRLLAASLFAFACTEIEPIEFGKGAAGTPCGQISDCVAGLLCHMEVCTEPNDFGEVSTRGDACTADTVCAEGECCGSQRVCRPVEASFMNQCGLGMGAQCGFTADCAPGLVCASSGECVSPNGAGTGELGASCQALADCRRPLVCGLDDKCQRLPFFAGVSCTKSEEEVGAFRMYFEVPRGALLEEFFRQPFPSDVRRKDDGHIVMDGYPSPGPVLGIDFTDLYVTAIEEDLDGFALTAPIFTQWSDQIDERTVTVNTSSATVWLVSLDDGVRVPLQFAVKESRGQLTCPNTLSVAPIDGIALEPNTTYALVMETGIKSKRGEAPVLDGDMRAMLAQAAPTDPALAKAHAAYAPFRTFVAARSIEAARIAGASVFTTGDPAAIASKIGAAVLADTAPVARGMVSCGGGAVSPCTAMMDMHRRCPGSSPSTYFEIQGTIDVPILQRGTRPYATPGPMSTEGAIELDAQGRVVVQGHERLCVALSIPKATAPAGGWPLVIYGHGTGGDYRSGIDQLASSMANIRGFGRAAVLSFDNVMHGPRQMLPEAAWQDPGDAFFNLQNPRAARDNILQGSSDILTLIRFARTATLTVMGVGSIQFNQERIVYYGHSQGTVIAPAMLAADDDLAAVVLTGAGAELGLSVLEKKKPKDVGALVRAAFADQSLTRMHPAIGLLSTFFGAADAPDYAETFSRRPFLFVYGLNDNYVPESTQMALVRGASLPIVGTVLRPIPGAMRVGATPPPSTGAVQFAPDGNYDGHFVGSQNAMAERLIEIFLGTSLGSARPEIRR